MKSVDTRSGMCWFAATCCGLAGFLLALAGITASEASAWSLAGIVFVLLAGAALIGMAVLMALGFRMEHRKGTPGGRSRESPG